MRVVISGAGAAGIAIAESLLTAGVGDVVVLDSKGILVPSRTELTGAKAKYAALTNPGRLEGGADVALAGADDFIEVSSSKVDEAHLAGMNEDAIIFALSNPDPEVLPDVAARYARVVSTERSDFANQISNVLAFHGIFR